MIDWQYKWVSEDALANASATSATPLFYLYIRTRWEPASDGMSKPCSEVLGYIQYNPRTELWAVFYHKGNKGAFAVNKNQLSAMVIVENFVKQKIQTA
jgi:hypothetical protein